jgi:PleD family two-component response regulator
MDKNLRILILEDCATDADLIEFELQEAQIHFISRRVRTEEAFVQALTEFSPDLILSDYDLPQYNGALALAEAKIRCPEVPFILITGAVGEDRAIEILTSGAKDYVMKHRLNRLAPAVLRALAEAEEHNALKKAEEELREAHRSMALQIEQKTMALEAERAARAQAEARHDKLLDEHNKALATIETLSGLLPVCPHCREKRDDPGYWLTLETYIRDHAEALLPQGICPACMEKLFPQIDPQPG